MPPNCDYLILPKDANNLQWRLPSLTSNVQENHPSCHDKQERVRALTPQLQGKTFQILSCTPKYYPWLLMLQSSTPKDKHDTGIYLSLSLVYTQTQHKHHTRKMHNCTPCVNVHMHACTICTGLKTDRSTPSLSSTVSIVLY